MSRRDWLLWRWQQASRRVARAMWALSRWTGNRTILWYWRDETPRKRLVIRLAHPGDTIIYKTERPLPQLHDGPDFRDCSAWRLTHPSDGITR